MKGLRFEEKIFAGICVFIIIERCERYNNERIKIWRKILAGIYKHLLTTYV